MTTMSGPELLSHSDGSTASALPVNPIPVWGKLTSDRGFWIGGLEMDRKVKRCGKTGPNFNNREFDYLVQLKFLVNPCDRVL
mmetsp:Transcript_40234/g.65205  ORF Transcript_40234/g.65205 Transcript_40234/m.65205 type:complete len:82 (-) Transcript_40234:243-488(-)